MSIYRDWFRRFFTFVVPLAFANYYPVLAILEKPAFLGAAWLSPIVGACFLFSSLRIWRFGVLHYTSTGS